MSPPCAREELTRWASGGAGRPLGEALERHLLDCRECAGEHAAIVEVRRRLEALPVRRIAADRLDAMRFELEAAARASGEARLARAPSTPPRRASWSATHARTTRILLAAAAVLVCAAALLLMPRRAAAPATSAMAEIQLDEAARGLLAHGGSDEVYALLRGSARFHVRPLRNGERFRVLAGSDRVEVRGTRFGVEVEGGRMMAVDVVEGAVLVTLAEGEEHLLVAGQSWRRAQPVARAAAAVAPAPADMAATPEASDGAGAVPMPQASNGAGARSHPGLVLVPPIGAPGAAAGPHVEAHAAPAPPAPPATAAAAGSASAEASAFDRRFRAALDRLKSGQAAEAARAFDELRSDAAADEGRRADVLYWAARAHAEAGRSADAEQRARALMEADPKSWHADDAALLLGETLLRRGDVTGARPWLERAARSPREAVRTRATRALEAAPPTR